MKYNVDYEHIFFDRYELSDKEKQCEAEEILKKAFKGIEYEAVWEKSELNIEIDSVEGEIRLSEIITILKKEFFILLKVKESADMSASRVDRVEKAEKYIKENYLYDTLTVTEVCDFCNENRKALDKAFVDKHSKTVNEYIKCFRVEKTKQYIAEGGRMEDIATLCGFGSVKTMQRAFKMVCGKTPGEYRRGQLDSKGTE